MFTLTENEFFRSAASTIFMSFSLKQIQYFLAATETRQFSTAAAKAHVTQTAITSAIEELESELGVTLFQRHHASGVSLTLDLATATLTRSRRQLWLSANHTLLSQRVIVLSDVQQLPYVLYDQDETPRNTLLFWEQFGLEPDIRYRVTSIEALRSLVAQGLAVTILSDVIYRPFSSEGLRIERRPLFEGLPPIEIGLVWPAERGLTGAVAAFSSFMQLTLDGSGAA